MEQAGESSQPTPNASSGEVERSHSRALFALLRLHWFIRLRWVFILIALVALLAEQLLQPQAMRPTQLLVAIMALTGINLVWMALSYFLLHQAKDADEDVSSADRGVQLFANGQVAVDLLFLTIILRYTGGVESPLTLFYLFHMVIGALVLARRQALIQGVWVVVLYSSLVLGEFFGLITPHYSLVPGLDSQYVYIQPVYVSILILVIASGVFGILYFTLHIASRLKKREIQLRQSNLDLQRSQAAIQALQGRRSRFMQTAAHQLKGPMAAIQTMTGLIRDNIVTGSAITKTCDKDHSAMSGWHRSGNRTTGFGPRARCRPSPS